MSEKSKFASKQNQSDTIGEARDFITVDSHGKAHIPSGSGRKSGRFLTNHELNMIAAHAEQIHEGLINKEDEALLDAVGILKDPKDIRDSLAVNGFLDDEEEKDWSDSDIQAYIDDARKNVDRYYGEQSNETGSYVGKRRANVAVDSESKAEDYVRKQDRLPGQHRDENIDEDNPIYDELMAELRRSDLAGADALEGESLEEYEARNSGGRHRRLSALPTNELDRIAAGRLPDVVGDTFHAPESSTDTRLAPLPTDALDAIANGLNIPSEMRSQSTGEADDDEDTDADSAELDPEKVAAIDKLEGSLSELRDRMAAATAKGQDRLYGKGGKKYAQLKAEYEVLVQELGKRHLALHEDFSDEDKNLVAMTVIVDEQAKLRNETIAELEGKPLGKFIKWMNKGNVATRIAKGVGLGALAGLSGAFVAGAVGAGAVAGGAVLASRFARNFALKDNRTRGMAAIYDDADRGIVADNGKSTAIDFDADELDSEAALNFTDANRMEKIQELTGLNKAFDDDTKKEQEKRRKSAAYGIAMMGTGALIGYGIHEGAEYLSEKNLSATHWLHEKWDNLWNGDQKTYAHDVDHDGIPDDKDNFVDKNNNGLDDRTGKPLNGSVPNSTKHPGLSWAEFSPSAHMVTPGEGWYQTFQELNIPHEHWADVLKDAGPKLHEQGWAYWDGAHSEWRISHTGKLPTSALKVIAAASKSDGFTLAA